ncbi:beta-lactamase superfamily II metal-dependent hydrolase [Hymenobacter sp. UYAg731]
MNELMILDVAHGSSSLLISGSASAIFDAAPKDVLLRTLAQYEVRTISHLFLSHLDRDHVGGVINLLASKNVQVENLIINADPTKTGTTNEELLTSIQDAVINKGLKIHRAYYPSTLAVGEVEIRTLAPSVFESLRGAGGQDEHGNEIDSNSSSIVLQLHHQGHPIAIFMGDIDQRALDSLIAGKEDLASDVLLFPHHGGHCAPDNSSFTKQLVEKVQPKVIIFSMGRTRHKNPRKEIVLAARQAAPNTYIACTQLSTNCLKDIPVERDNWESHLPELPGAGIEDAHSCFGALHLHLNGSATIYPNPAGLHNKFVKLHVPSALCQ